MPAIIQARWKILASYDLWDADQNYGNPTTIPEAAGIGSVSRLSTLLVTTIIPMGHLPYLPAYATGYGSLDGICQYGCGVILPWGKIWPLF